MTSPPDPASPDPARLPPKVGRRRLAALTSAADAAGHRVVELELAGCTDKTSLLAQAARAFSFPGWFGHNWDALADSLGDLSWLDAPGYLLVLRHADRLETLAPEIWQTLCEILADVAADRRTEGIRWCTVRCEDDS